MNKNIKNTFKVSLFIGVGIILFLLVYRDMDFETILEELKKINYWWFLLVALVSGLSNVSRAMRWQMLIKTYGGKSGFINTFLAVLTGYFANMALPRLGEVSRCAIITKYEKEPFSKVLGTMVSERLVDMLTMILFIILIFFIQQEIILQFIYNNPEIEAQTTALFSLKFIIIIIILLLFSILFIYFLVKGRFNKYALFKKSSEFIKSFWIALISIKKVKNVPLFIFHSLFIWVMYFLMIYFAFPAFEGFEDFSIIVALTIFVAASFGMLAPAPNGVGAYHFMVSQTLVLYGVAIENALIFALVVHGVQTILIIIGGLASLIALPTLNNNKKPKLIEDI